MAHNRSLMSEWRFADEIKLKPLHVARAALYFAQEIAYPQLNIIHCLNQLAELAEMARPYLDDEPSRLRQGVLLAEFLFGAQGLRGNAEDYGDPRNSFLNEVLDRRLGLPISLTVIYIHVAQRLHIPAYGIGLPGHFIAGVEERGQMWLFDPFHGGGRLSINDCARLVQRSTNYEGPFRREWLAPVTSASILVRMLSNLRISYVQHRLWDKAVVTINLLRQLQPGVAEHWRDLGLVYYRKGVPHLTAQYLDTYMQLQPEATDAQSIREGIESLLNDWARNN